MCSVSDSLNKKKNHENNSGEKREYQETKNERKVRRFKDGRIEKGVLL